MTPRPIVRSPQEIEEMLAECNRRARSRVLVVCAMTPDTHCCPEECSTRETLRWLQGRPLYDQEGDRR